MDIESIVNQAAASLSQSALEDQKATKAAIRAESAVIRDKRQERIDNLVKQMKGLQASPGGCVKFLRAIFRVIDFLAKPLSALTLNKLKIDLTKVLDTLKEQKNQEGLTRLKIRGDEILKTIQEFKSLLSDDTESLRSQDKQSARETKRLLEVIEDLHETYQTTTRG